MPTLNKESKTITHDDLMNHYESAFQQVQAISEDHPEEASRLYARLASSLLDLMHHQVKALM